MYEKGIEIKTTDRCNYIIEMGPKDKNIFFSLNELGYILPKLAFLSFGQKKINKIDSEKVPIFILDDIISCPKFTAIINTFL